MISSASSFQRRQSRSVSITLAPTNPHWTFASTKFRRTSGELYRRNRELPVQVDTTLEFPSSSSMLWCGGLLDPMLAASSSLTPASSSVVVVHLWPKASTPLRSSCRFLSILPFSLQFRGRSNLIPFAFSFSTCNCSSRPVQPPPANSRRRFASLPLVSTSLRSPRSPPSVPQLSRALGCPDLPPIGSARSHLSSCTSVPCAKVEEDKVIL
jgi:hypothetical protein